MSTLAKKVFELFGTPEGAETSKPTSVEKRQNTYPPWPCPHCGNPAEIDDVFPSLDEERTLTLWRCEPCQTVGVTPNTLREPPVWVPAKEQRGRGKERYECNVYV